MLQLLSCWKDQPANNTNMDKVKTIKAPLVFPAPQLAVNCGVWMLLNIFYAWTNIIKDIVHVLFLQQCDSPMHTVLQLALLTYRSGLTSS